jgi:hypothetical protein
MLSLLDPTAEIMWPAAICATLIVLFGWVLIVRSVTKSLNEKVAASTVQDEVENKLGIYLISAIFWPAALVMGNTFLKKPETVQTGRICIIIFLWFMTFVVLVANALVLIGVAYLPEIIHFLKGHGIL